MHTKEIPGKPQTHTTPVLVKAECPLRVYRDMELVTIHLPGYAIDGAGLYLFKSTKQAKQRPSGFWTITHHSGYTITQNDRRMSQAEVLDCLWPLLALDWTGEASEIQGSAEHRQAVEAAKAALEGRPTRADDLAYIKAAYDNGGTTADRYTVVYSDGSGVSCSPEPNHPQGFCQTCEGVIEGPHLGRRIPWAELPHKVLVHLSQIQQRRN